MKHANPTCSLYWSIYNVYTYTYSIFVCVGGIFLISQPPASISLAITTGSSEAVRAVFSPSLVTVLITELLGSASSRALTHWRKAFSQHLYKAVRPLLSTKLKSMSTKEKEIMGLLSNLGQMGSASSRALTHWRKAFSQHLYKAVRPLLSTKLKSMSTKEKEIMGLLSNLGQMW